MLFNSLAFTTHRCQAAIGWRRKQPGNKPMINGVWFGACSRMGRTTYIQTASATLASLPSMVRRRSSSNVIILVTLAHRELVASDLGLSTDAVTATSFLSEPSDSLFVRIRS